MRKEKLTQAVTKAKSEMQAALQTVYDALNPGQQKQIIKNESVRWLFDLYGVKYEGVSGDADNGQDQDAD